MSNKILDKVLKVVKIILSVISIIFIVFLIIVLTILLFFPFSDWGTYCDKKELQTTIISAIQKGAPLDQIEYKYNNREKVFLSQIKKLIDFKNEKYYPMDVSLYTVLMDIKMTYYENNDFALTGDIIKRIDKLIDELKNENPFNRLSPQQRYFFESIYKKLGKNYNKIDTDMNKIYLDMEYKNKKIEEYKSKAKWGYMLSIFCLAVTLVMLLVLIVFFIRNRIKKMKKNPESTENAVLE